jgi:F0F1-type ATP synthase epsilon subunit
MSKESVIHFVVRTPSAIVFEGDVSSLRVLTQTGLVGLRPRTEPTVLAVESGLVVMKTVKGIKYAGTAGGLLHCDGASASLLTPLAVVSEDIESVSKELDRLIGTPSQEMDVRQALGRLEQRILQELRHEDEVQKPVRH